MLQGASGCAVAGAVWGSGVSQAVCAHPWGSMGCESLSRGAHAELRAGGDGMCLGRLLRVPKHLLETSEPPGAVGGVQIWLSAWQWV